MFEVRALYVKPHPGAPMLRARGVTGLAGAGLAGDCSADPASPRQVLLVDHASLRALRLRGPDLRPNLVLGGDLRALSSGSILDLGDLRLRITIPCEPCAKLDRARPGLFREVGVRRGVLARVLSSGAVQIGDRGRLSPLRAVPLDAIWRARALHIVSQIPRGRVMTYAALARLAGVLPAYCRALPTVLRSSPARGLPVHRVVPSSLGKLGAAQHRALLDEGVDLLHGLHGLDALHPPAGAHWDGAAYYSAQESGLSSSDSGGARGATRRA